MTRIYNYYKKFGYETQVMGASFRNAGEIGQLAGCDLLTISPALLDELHSVEGEMPALLSPAAAKASDERRVTLDEAAFRFELNQDACATEKLAEGIRGFAADTVKLEQFLRRKMDQMQQ